MVLKSGVILPFRGPLEMSGDIFICHSSGGVVIMYMWHLVSGGQPHTTKSCRAQNVSSAEAEKSCYRKIKMTSQYIDSHVVTEL